jgi:hypothetical protein
LTGPPLSRRRCYYATNLGTVPDRKTADKSLTVVSAMAGGCSWCCSLLNVPALLPSSCMQGAWGAPHPPPHQQHHAHTGAPPTPPPPCEQVDPIPYPGQDPPPEFGDAETVLNIMEKKGGLIFAPPGNMLHVRAPQARMAKCNARGVPVLAALPSGA